MSKPKIVANSWSFDHYFDPATPWERPPDEHPTIVAGRQALQAAHIEKHPFFSYASEMRESLYWWATQEAVITNHFSQTLFYLLSTIKNVHVRSILAPVVVGEHSALRAGVAYLAHPHLLATLLRDMGIDPALIRPLPFTVAFSDIMSASLHSPLYALGVLGIGNELMLVPEYTAVERVFALHYPRDFYRAFLRANIDEDTTHAELMETAAICLIRTAQDDESYRLGARDGVAARLTYYDALFAHCLGASARESTVEGCLS